MTGPRLLLLSSLNHSPLDGPLWSSATCWQYRRQSWFIGIKLRNGVKTNITVVSGMAYFNRTLLSVK